jgi:hypothetical protein
LWVTPSKPGVYSVTLRAKDLSGNEEVANGTITVKAASGTGRRSARAARMQRISPPARQPAGL